MNAASSGFPAVIEVTEVVLVFGPEGPRLFGTEILLGLEVCQQVRHQSIQFAFGRVGRRTGSNALHKHFRVPLPLLQRFDVLFPVSVSVYINIKAAHARMLKY